MYEHPENRRKQGVREWNAICARFIVKLNYQKRTNFRCLLWFLICSERAARNFDGPFKAIEVAR